MTLEFLVHLLSVSGLEARMSVGLRPAQHFGGVYENHDTDARDLDFSDCHRDGSGPEGLHTRQLRLRLC